MAKQMLMVMWCVLNLSLLRTTGSAALQLNVSPATVVVDLTRMLEINCTFSYQSSPSISNLISLIVSRSDDQQNGSAPFVLELASINEFNPDQVHKITPIDASVSGQIRGDVISYLSLQWAYPGADEAGLYRCKALGVDKFGHIVDAEDTHLVTISEPGLDQLIEVVRLQQTQMDTILNVLSSLSTSLANVDNKVSTLSNDLGILMNEVDTLNTTVTDEKKEVPEYKDSILMQSLTMSYIKSDEYQDRYYLLPTDGMFDIVMDQAACLIEGGYLSEINDETEHNFIKNFLNVSLPQHFSGVFFGPIVRNQTGEWVFTQSHQVMNYNDSMLVGPDDRVNEKLCLYAERANDWTISSRYCFSYFLLYPFLCEVPISRDPHAT